jgi:LysM repeat protein
MALAAGLLLCAGNAQASPKTTKHTVVRGDTLTGIAQQHDVSVNDLRRWNHIQGDVIRLGEQLRLRAPGQDYTIAKGDTISRIATKRGLSVEDVVALNPGLNPNRIRIGQVIQVPPPKVIPPPEKKPLACPGRVVQISNHGAYRVRNRNLAWATSFSADAIRRGFTLVRDRYGNYPRARVLDASARGGGPLGEHLSHQEFRDVDITYFQKRCGHAGCPVVSVDPDDLDVERQWALLRYWLDNDDVEYLFVDHKLQRVLYEQAKKDGATEEQLDEWFQYPRPAHVHHGIIRHWEGHQNHVHVRFHETSCDNGCCSSSAPSVASKEDDDDQRTASLSSKRRKKRRRR